MNKAILIIVILIAIIGGVYLYSSGLARKPVVAEKKMELPKSPSVEEKAVTPGSLFDIQSSIQNEVEGSVQEDIQQAVERKIKNSGEDR